MGDATRRLEIRKGDPVDVEVPLAAGAPRGARFRVCRRDVGEDGGHTVALLAAPAGASPEREILRFDLFRRDPHYHVPSSEPAQLDIVAARDGDPLAFVLGCIRARLPELVERAGDPDLAGALDRGALSALAERVGAAIASAPEPTHSEWIELPPA